MRAKCAISLAVNAWMCTSWCELAQGAHHVEVVLERQVGVLPADDVDLAHAALREGLRGLLDDLVDTQGEGVLVAFVVTEGAEEAAVAADVGVVDVPVADEVDLVAHVARTDEVGHGAQRQQVAGLQQRRGLGDVEPATGLDGTPDALEAGAHGQGSDLIGMHGTDSRRVSYSGRRPAPPPVRADRAPPHRDSREHAASLLNVPQSDGAGTLEGATAGDEAQRFVHLGGGGLGAREQWSEPRLRLESVDDGERDGAVAHIGARPLAGRLLVAAAVEDVVEHLEGQADEAAVLGQRSGRRGRPAQQRAEPARGREEVGGLALTAALVLRRRDRETVRVVALDDLTLGQTDGRRAQRVHGGGVAAPRRAPGTRAPGGSCRPRRRSRTPKACATVGRPRRSSARSRTSSWTSVAMCSNSTAVAPRRAGSPKATSARAQSSVSSGRTRLPPAASVARQASPSGPAGPAAAASRRPSTRLMAFPYRAFCRVDAQTSSVRPVTVSPALPRAPRLRAGRPSRGRGAGSGRAPGPPGT